MLQDHSISNMDIKLLIFIALAIGATFFAVVASLGLVIHKAIHAQTIRKRQHLYSFYSDLIAELLLQNVLPLSPDARTSAIFNQYEIIIQPIKNRLREMSQLKCKIEREILRSVLIDFAKDVRGEISDRLVYFFYSFGFVDEQIKLLSDRRWWIRAQAARDAGLLKARRAITAITACLEDVHPDVRLQSMVSLIRLVGVEAFKTIFRVSKELSLWTAVELSTVIKEYKETTIPYLIEGLQNDSQSVVLFCIEMLAEIGFISAVEPLRKIVENCQDVTIRMKAIEALGRLGDGRAETILLSNLDHAHSEVRLKSMEALERVGAYSAIPILIERMKQNGGNEKIFSARAIASTGKSGVEELNALAQNNKFLLRAVVEQVLEEYQFRVEQV